MFIAAPRTLGTDSAFLRSSSERGTRECSSVYGQRRTVGLQRDVSFLSCGLRSSMRHGRGRSRPARQFRSVHGMPRRWTLKISLARTGKSSERGDSRARPTGKLGTSFVGTHLPFGASLPGGRGNSGPRSRPFSRGFMDSLTRFRPDRTRGPSRCSNLDQKLRRFRTRE